MNWSQLEYLCRRISFGKDQHQDLPQNKSASQVFFTQSQTYQHLCEKAYKTLVDSSAEHDKRSAIQIYSQTDFGLELSKPLPITRFYIYFLYLFFAYLLMFSIYYFFVFPSFYQGLLEVSIIEAETLSNRRTLLLIASCVTTIFLILSGYASFQLNRLARGIKLVNEQSRYWWLPNKIKRLSLMISETLLYPLFKQKTDSSLSLMVNYSNEPIVIARELTIRLKELHFEINQLCEKQMRIILTFSGMLIVFCIFLFLSSTYSPIFRFANSL